jgi:hypothetical protein
MDKTLKLTTYRRSILTASRRISRSTLNYLNFKYLYPSQKVQ